MTAASLIIFGPIPSKTVALDGSRKMNIIQQNLVSCYKRNPKSNFIRNFIVYACFEFFNIQLASACIYVS